MLTCNETMLAIELYNVALGPGVETWVKWWWFFNCQGIG